MLELLDDDDAVLANDIASTMMTIQSGQASVAILPLVLLLRKQYHGLST